MKNNRKPLTWITLFYGATLLAAVVLLWKTGGHPSFKTPAVAIVSLEGPIRIGDSPGLSATNPRELIKTLEDLEDNQRIRAIVIRINSPGGSVAAVQEIDEEVRRLRSKGKIFVASLGDVAASGGYYVASGCNRIVADPGTLTGSIGVILEVADAEELMKKVGLKIDAVKSGAFKDAGSPFRPLSAEERRWFQGLINQAYEQFLTAVSNGRGIRRADLLPLADGRVFTGELAKEKKLVDELGSEQDAIREAKRLVGITDDQAPVLDLSEESPLNRLLDMAGSLPALNFKVAKPSPRFEYIWE
jgi:protease-4